MCSTPSGLGERVTRVEAILTALALHKLMFRLENRTSVLLTTPQYIHKMMHRGSRMNMHLLMLEIQRELPLQLLPLWYVSLTMGVPVTSDSQQTERSPGATEAFLLHSCPRSCTHRSLLLEQAQPLSPCLLVTTDGWLVPCSAGPSTAVLASSLPRAPSQPAGWPSACRPEAGERSSLTGLLEE